MPLMFWHRACHLRDVVAKVDIARGKWESTLSAKRVVHVIFYDEEQACVVWTVTSRDPSQSLWWIVNFHVVVDEGACV